MKLEQLLGTTGLSEEELNQLVQDKYADCLKRSDIGGYKSLLNSTSIKPQVSQKIISKAIAEYLSRMAEYYYCCSRPDIKHVQTLEELVKLADARTLNKERCSDAVQKVFLNCIRGDRFDLFEKVAELIEAIPLEATMQQGYIERILTTFRLEHKPLDKLIADWEKITGVLFSPPNEKTTILKDIWFKNNDMSYYKDMNSWGEMIAALYSHLVGIRNFPNLKGVIKLSGIKPSPEMVQGWYPDYLLSSIMPDVYDTSKEDRNGDSFLQLRKITGIDISEKSLREVYNYVLDDILALTIESAIECDRDDFPTTDYATDYATEFRKKSKKLNKYLSGLESILGTKIPDQILQSRYISLLDSDDISGMKLLRHVTKVVPVLPQDVLQKKYNSYMAIQNHNYVEGWFDAVETLAEVTDVHPEIFDKNIQNQYFQFSTKWAYNEFISNPNSLKQSYSRIMKLTGKRIAPETVQSLYQELIADPDGRHLDKVCQLKAVTGIKPELSPSAIQKAYTIYVTHTYELKECTKKINQFSEFLEETLSPEQRKSLIGYFLKKTLTFE